MAETLHLFDGATGGHITRLPFSAMGFSESISEPGSMSATIPDTPAVHALDLDALLAPWTRIVAWVDTAHPTTVRHAGYVTRAAHDPQTGAWTVDAGGGWTILEKRLVLNALLKGGWHDGVVLIDEDNPPGDWILHLTGTYRDIARGLIAETMEWGPLPFTLPPVQGGDAHERTYQSWDLSTVSERLGDLADLQDGPEIRFDPTLDDDWRLSFALRVGDPEIVDHERRLNALVPGQRVAWTATDTDGDLMTDMVFAVGGKNDDEVLMCRRTAATPSSVLLQTANTSHSTVSVLKTLQSYAQGDIDAGGGQQATHRVTAGMEQDWHVGDHLDLRTRRGVLNLKITDVSLTAGDDMQTLQCREREGAT